MKLWFSFIFFPTEILLCCEKEHQWSDDKTLVTSDYYIEIPVTHFWPLHNKLAVSGKAVKQNSVVNTHSILHSKGKAQQVTYHTEFCRVLRGSCFLLIYLFCTVCPALLLSVLVLGLLVYCLNSLPGAHWLGLTPRACWPGCSTQIQVFTWCDT